MKSSVSRFRFVVSVAAGLQLHRVNRALDGFRDAFLTRLASKSSTVPWNGRDRIPPVRPRETLSKASSECGKRARLPRSGSQVARPVVGEPSDFALELATIYGRRVRFPFVPLGVRFLFRGVRRTRPPSA